MWGRMVSVWGAGPRLQARLQGSGPQLPRRAPCAPQWMSTTPATPCPAPWRPRPTPRRPRSPSPWARPPQVRLPGLQAPLCTCRATSRAMHAQRPPPGARGHRQLVPAEAARAWQLALPGPPPLPGRLPPTLRPIWRCRGRRAPPPGFTPPLGLWAAADRALRRYRRYRSPALAGGNGFAGFAKSAALRIPRTSVAHLLEQRLRSSNGNGGSLAGGRRAGRAAAGGDPASALEGRAAARRAPAAPAA